MTYFFSTIRIPFPPPPALAFIMIGYPISSATFLASFNVSSNNQRSGSRPILTSSETNAEDAEVLAQEDVDDIFQPSEAFGSPLAKYYFELADSEYLIENNLIPSFNKATFGDCCFRNDSTTERGDRVFSPGAKIAYFTPEAAELEGWSLHSLTCNFVVINKLYQE